MYVDGIPLPEVPFREEQLTGSGVGSGVDAGAGAGVDNTGNRLTPMSINDEEFSVAPDEQVGQLYAYRINDSAVILGTRESSTFGASIGIGSVAGRTYQCLAENANANRDSRITISCLLYTSPSPRDATLSRMPSSA